MPVDTEKGRAMRPFAFLTAALAALSVRLEADDPERGDVPGWVMVTLMTAIVIAGLTPFVGDELRALLERAFSMVSG